MNKFARYFVAAMTVAMVSLSSKATILVYDGVPLGTGGYPAAGGTPKSYTLTHSSIIGFSSGDKWDSSTGVARCFGTDNGLAFPPCFTNDNHNIAPIGGSLGFKDTNNPGTGSVRGTYRKLTPVTPFKDCQTLYFRALIRTDGTVSETVADGGRTGIGFHRATFGGTTSDANLTNDGLWFAFKRSGSNLYPIMRLMGTDYQLSSTAVAQWNTWIFIAKVEVGAGTAGKEVVSAYAARVSTTGNAAYTPDFEWCNLVGTDNSVEVEMIGDSATLNYLGYRGAYQTNNKMVRFDEAAIATELDDIAVATPVSKPSIKDPTMEKISGGYTVGATITTAAATDCGVLAVDENGYATKFSAGSFEMLGTQFSKTVNISELSVDATYEIQVYAENSNGAVTNTVGYIYNGALSLEWVKDADEYKCVPGEVLVSRPSPEYLPLTVNYSITPKTVGTEGTTWEAPQSVTIQPGETSATLTVKPIPDSGISEDITVTVNTAEGNYEDAAQGVDVVIKNLTTPSGYNVWVAMDGSDGLASTASNWSNGAPTSEDKVLFDGDFSSVDCVWDDAATVTVQEFNTTDAFTGKITFGTTFDGSFTSFATTGNMTINGGTLTHKSHTSTYKCDYYRLKLSIGGNLTVGAHGSISARAKGSYCVPTGRAASAYGGSYNGNRAWGSLAEPVSVGTSGHNTGDAAWAGGALWIEVAGAANVNGSISANGIKGQVGDAFAGSGGSIYLRSATLAGSGTISADCEMVDRSSNTRSGAGGRISILLTSGEFTDFPSANITAYAANPSYANVGGCGTVLVRTPAKPNGILYLADRSTRYNSAYGYHPKFNYATDIPNNATWRLDGIVFGYGAILRVANGSTLELPNGLTSVTGGASDASSGILVDGGTLTIPDGNQTISGGWVFEPNQEFTINGDLTLSNSGKVGAMYIYATTTNELRRCRLRVTGNMTVDEGASIYAVQGGYDAANASVPGGTSISVHGGQCGYQSGNKSYGSVFNPQEAGAFGVGTAHHPGSGAVILKVDGTLTMNGKANTDAVWKSGDQRPGAAGTINITAGRLEGTGSMSANGSERAYWYADRNKCGDSAGGRIAVRLTDSGATFSDYWVAHINAMGKTYTGTNGDGGTPAEKAANSASAGTVYLQAGNEAEGAGTIYVRNDNKSTYDAVYTPLPSTKFGGENDVYKKASLVVDGKSIVKLFDSLKMQKLDVATNSGLDLNGKTLTVKNAKIGGDKVPVGKHIVAAGEPSPDFLGLRNTAATDGTLEVVPSCTMVILQ